MTKKNENKKGVMMKTSNYIVQGMLTLSFSVAILACSNEVEKPVTKYKVPVSISKVKKVNRSFPITTTAILAKSSEMQLSFKIGGIIDKFYIQAGDYVKKGQLLAALNQTEVKARTNQAASALDKARRDMERVQKLYEDSVATLEQLQNVRTGLDVAKNNLRIAKYNLKHSTISAPVSGKVLMTFHEAHELVGPGTPIVIMGAGQDNWKLKAGIIDRDILKLSLGDTARVAFDAYPEKHFNGRVTEISGAANPATGLFEVEITLNPTTTPLFSGFIGKVDLLPQKKNRYDVVSIDAITEGDGDFAFVYVPDESGQKARKIKIKVGHIMNTRVFVSAGLEGVETIISRGSAYLTDNVDIDIKKM